MTSYDRQGPQAEFRHAAEKQWRARRPDVPRAEDALRLIQELQVHQIELEMQNEELRRVRDELDASATRFSELYDFAPVGYLTLDRDGTIVEINLVGAGMLGRERARLLGQRFASWLTPSTRPALARLFAALREEQRASCDLALRSEEDGPRYVHADAVPESPIREKGWRCRMALTDVTESERLREQLAAKDQFAKVAESVPGTIFSQRIRPDGSASMPFATAAMEDLYGISREVLATDMTPWARNVHPDDLSQVKKALAIAAETLSPWHDEFRYLHPAKGLRWIEGWSSPTAEPDGSALLHGFAMDVTERKDANLAHREQAALLNLARDAIIVLGADDVVTYWNHGAEDTYGFTEAEARGRVLHDLLRTRLPEPLESLSRVLLERGRWEGEVSHTRKDGREIVVASRWVVQKDQAGQVMGYLGINRDVTEQHRLREEFQQLQRLESVGRLAGGIAHDFNNILAVVLSCAEMLKDELAAGAPAQPELVEEIHVAGKRAAELTRQLLTFARKQIISSVPSDLNCVVRASEKLLRRVLGEDIELEVALQPGVWMVRCDAGQMDQVILNLAINARDAMPRGGRLTIETTNIETDESLVAAHPFIRAGPYVRLRISDSGEGMTPEAQTHAFEPFFTTKPEGKGTELGLATVYGIVKQSGGYILLTSEAGRGTAFELYFPRTLEATVSATAGATAMSGGTETVLVVEDDPQLLQTALRSLREGGYRVIAARGGREALDAAAREKGPVHLLLTDVTMPGLSGPEVAAELRLRQPDLRVLYVSGYAQESTVHGGPLEPGMELLPKPFAASVLRERVRKALDTR